MTPAPRMKIDFTVFPFTAYASNVSPRRMILLALSTQAVANPDRRAARPMQPGKALRMMTRDANAPQLQPVLAPGLSRGPLERKS